MTCPAATYAAIRASAPDLVELPLKPALSAKARFGLVTLAAGYLQPDMIPKQTRDGYPVRQGYGVLPGAAAITGVPAGAMMSIASWILAPPARAICSNALSPTRCLQRRWSTPPRASRRPR